MRVIVAGSSNHLNPQDVYAAIDAAVAKGLVISEIVSGAAPGVDTYGEIWAKRHDIPIQRMPADFRKFGKKGGMIRNMNMAVYAKTGPEGGALVLVWYGDQETSPGSANMLQTARKFNLPIYETIVQQNKE